MLNPLAYPPQRHTGADPAADAEFAVTIPTGETWSLLAVYAQLAQGATQTPQPTLIIDDGTDTGIVFAALGASSAQNASVTCDYHWAPGLALTAGAANTRAYAPLPLGLLLPGGYRIRSSTAGKGANTNYGAPGLLIIKY